MRVMYESDFNKAKLQLSRNVVIGYNGSKEIVAMAYKKLKSDIDKDLVGSRGLFVLIVDSWC